MPFGGAELEEVHARGSVRAAGAAPLGAQEPISLRILWERYSRECGEFLDNARETRADAQRSAQLLMAVLGEGREVRTISARDIAQYGERRKHGGIRYKISSRGTPTLKTTPPVRQTAVHRDLTTLRTMLRWARTVVTADGQRRWLEVDPLEGLRFEKERSPKRPLASHERYETTLKGVRQLAANEPKNVDDSGGSGSSWRCSWPAPPDGGVAPSSVCGGRKSIFGSGGSPGAPSTTRSGSSG